MRKRTLRSALIIALLSAIFAAVPAAHAAPGSIDFNFASFGINLGYGPEGRAFLDALSKPNGIVVQPDGKIVVAGRGTGVDMLAVMRFMPDGQPDYDFGSGGIVALSDMFHVEDVALQLDGRIVVGGTRNDDFHLARLMPDGELDPSFDFDGWFADIDAQLTTLGDVLVQADGKIVACGSAKVDGDFDFGVVRYDANGWRDTSFSDDGKATIPFGAEDECSSIAQQSDGKLVLAGVSAGSSGDFAVARFNPDGTRDNSFDGDAKLTTNFGGDEVATAVAIQNDGQIVVLGNRSAQNALDSSYIARYLPNGALDATFGSGGKLAITADRLFDLALQPDGKLLMSGYREFSHKAPLFIVRRLHPAGAPDMTFSGDSVVEFSFISGTDSSALALQPDGRILAASANSSITKGAPELWRLWPDGSLNTGGRQTHGLAFPPEYQGGYRETVNGMAHQPNEGLVVAGEAYVPDYSHSMAFITRFTGNAQVDATFGVNGSVWIAPGKFNAARAVAVQSDGKIVIAGYSNFSADRSLTDFLVARFKPDGSPDLSFGHQGSFIRDFAGGADAAAALAITPDGKIVAAGSVWNGVRYDWGVLRLTSDGQVDASFDEDGIFTFGLGLDNGLNALAVQPDGKILLAGHIGRDFTVARLLDNGKIDPSFGNSGGFAFNDLGGTDVIFGLALASDGWIYAAGYRVSNRNGDMALAQYTPDGILASCADPMACDNWPTGTFFVDAGINDYAYALDLRNDNQLVAAGCSNQHFAGVQVRTDRAPRPLAFNTDFVGYPDCAKAVMFSGSKGIVMAGDQDSYPFSRDSNIALAGFETTEAWAAPGSEANQEAVPGSELGTEQEPSGNVDVTSAAAPDTPADAGAASGAETHPPSE